MNPTHNSVFAVAGSVLVAALALKSRPKVKLFLLLLLIAFMPGACTTEPRKHDAVIEEPPYRGPSPQKIAEAIRYAQQGLPFAVEIDPPAAIDEAPAGWGELEHLKEKFLRPLANSRHTSEIQRVRINASGEEWQHWTCIIDLKDSRLGPISLTHFAGFYDGRQNDPDGYAKARQYALNALTRIFRDM